MGYKTILAYLNDEKQADRVLTAAAQVARKTNAHVIGLYVVPAFRVYPAVQAYITSEVVDMQKRHFREQAEKLKKIFDEKMASEDFVSEWRAIESQVPDRTQLVMKHGRMVDLIVLGQSDPSEDREERDLVEHVIMDSGRPVLVVPASGRLESIGSYVLLAWDGGREAARAAFDALPLMEGAEEVRVHSVNPPDKEGSNTFLPGAELSSSLARHGIKVETAQSVARSGAIGEELLSRVSDHGCDLIVMGGYAHSRMREIILGGATRHIAEQMTVPVLFSH